MNSKFLYAATLAVSLLGTLVMANEAPAGAAPSTHTQVDAELATAIADATPAHRESSDDGPQTPAVSSPGGISPLGRPGDG